MYRSILVPLDGSTFAEHVLPLARSIARRAGAALQLALVHVPIAARYVDGMVIYDEPLDARLKEHEREYLNEVTKRVATDLDVPVTFELIDGKVGQVAEILHDHAMAKNVDLIAMTTHGRGAFTRFWLGSVADKLVRQVSMPILLVRPQENEKTQIDITQEQVFQHILITLDGSALSEQILDRAVALGKLLQADYTLLRVMEPWLPISYPSTEYSIKVDEELQKQVQTEAQTYLDSVAERLRAQSLQVQTKVVLHRQPAIAILDEVGKDEVDAIAMATHGWGGLTRLIMGSVADKVLRGVSKPVLLYRPHGES